MRMYLPSKARLFRIRGSNISQLHQICILYYFILSQLGIRSFDEICLCRFLLRILLKGIQNLALEDF